MLQRDGAPAHCTLRETLVLLTHSLRMSASLSQTCCPNSPDFDLMDYTIWGPAGASLPRQELQHR